MGIVHGTHHRLTLKNCLAWVHAWGFNDTHRSALAGTSTGRRRQRWGRDRCKSWCECSGGKLLLHSVTAVCACARASLLLRLCVATHTSTSCPGIVSLPHPTPPRHLRQTTSSPTATATVTRLSEPAHLYISVSPHHDTFNIKTFNIIERAHMQHVYGNCVCLGMGYGTRVAGA